MENEVAEIAKGSAYMLTVELTAILISLVSFKFMTEYLELHEMGIWTVMNMSMAILGLAMRVVSGSVKFISQAVGAGEDYASVITSIIFGRVLIGCSIAISYITLRLVGCSPFRSH